MSDTRSRTRRRVLGLGLGAAGVVAATVAGRNYVADAVSARPAAVSVREHGAVGDGETDDTDALNEAREAALDRHLPLYLPAGTYKITSALDWRREGLHAFGDGRNLSMVAQAGRNRPIVLLGEQHQHVHDLSFQYADQAATGDTGSVAIELYKPSYCTYERLTTFWAHTGIALHRGPYRARTDKAESNWFFSCTFRDLEILGFRASGIDTTPYQAANTGSVWENIYVRNGPTGPAEETSTHPVVVRGCDEQLFNQLNVESVLLAHSDAVLVHGSSAVFNGLHFEGLVVSGWDGGLVQAYDAGSTQINMMTVQGTTFVADRNVKSTIKIGRRAQVFLRGLTIRNATIIQSQSFVLMHSLDQTGTFFGTEIDLAHFTTRTAGDTATTHVAKQINDMTNFIPLTFP